ncbi:MAG: RNA-binding protein [Bacteroidota bacterium]
MIKLFISGYPLDMTELEIVQLVAFHAEVCTIKLVRDKKTKQAKGYSFIEVTDLAGAEQAVEILNGAPLAGRKLSVSIVEDKPVAVKPSYKPSRQVRR